MRDLKFRVYLPARKEFAYVEMQGLGSFRYTPVESNNYPELYELNVNESTPSMVMQFTGFQDRNGADVYELDLIRVEKGVYRVLWSEKSAKFILELTAGTQGGRNFRTVRLGHVVGNVYENKALQ